MRRPVLFLLFLSCLLNACGNGEDPAREDEDGDGYTVAEGDCNDGDPNIYPGALDRPAASEEEIGQGNGIDEDCDEIEAVLCFRDADNDGHGRPGETAADPAGNCETSPYFSLTNGDCADNDPAVHPGAEEVCDGRDNDCNGVVDPPFDDDPDAWSVGYIDEDQDGDGALGAEQIMRCVSDTLLAPTANDCDDTDPQVRGRDENNDFPDEICDGKDNDCNGDYLAGEDPTNPTDLDGDGYVACSCPDCICDPASWDLRHCGDCSDDPTTDQYAAWINPGAFDWCFDSVDNDCDGQTDEIEDSDGDGWLNCDEFSGGQMDCDDANPDINPDAVEPSGSCEDVDCDGETGSSNGPDLCDGLDNDCDGIFDEDEATIMIVSTDPSMGTALHALLAQSDPGPSYCSGYVDGNGFRENDVHSELSLEGFKLVIFTPDMVNHLGEPIGQPFAPGLIQVIEDSYMNTSTNSTLPVPSLLGMGYAGKALYAALSNFGGYDPENLGGSENLGLQTMGQDLAVQCAAEPTIDCGTGLGVALPSSPCSFLEQFGKPDTNSTESLFFTSPNQVVFDIGTWEDFAAAIDLSHPNPGSAFPLWSGSANNSGPPSFVQYIAEPGCSPAGAGCWSPCLSRGLVARETIHFYGSPASIPGQPTVADPAMLYHWGWDASPDAWTDASRKLFKNIACWVHGDANCATSAPLGP